MLSNNSALDSLPTAIHLNPYDTCRNNFVVYRAKKPHHLLLCSSFEPQVWPKNQQVLSPTILWQGIVTVQV